MIEYYFLIIPFLQIFCTRILLPNRRLLQFLYSYLLVKLYCFYNPLLELHLRLPSELITNLRCIDCIPFIMSWTVWNKGNQGFIFSHCIKKNFGNLQVCIFIIPSHIIDTSRLCTNEHFPDSITVILDIKPITDIGPISIKWNFFISCYFRDKKRNQRNEVLIDSVVVGASSDRIVYAKSPTIRLCQHITSSF